MSEQPHHLFSYGTLRQPEVQMATFGRLLEGIADRLPGFRIEMLEIADATVIATSGKHRHPIAVPSSDPGDAVDGTVFRIGEEDIRTADAYEVADYARVPALLASGIVAWVYVSAGRDAEATHLPATATPDGGHAG